MLANNNTMYNIPRREFSWFTQTKVINNVFDISEYQSVQDWIQSDQKNLSALSSTFVCHFYDTCAALVVE